MVAVASASFFESAVTKKTAFSQEGLRALFGQVEAELYRSEIYQRVLASLQTATGDRADNPQLMVRAVAREAIRLAFRQMVKQYQTGGMTHQLVSQPSAVDGLSSVAPKINPEKSSTVSSFPEVAQDVTKAQPSVSNTPQKAVHPSQSINRPRQGDDPPRMIVSTSRKSARSDSPANQKRLALLRQIGATLQQTRQEKGISLDQLYNLTWIPVHQIRALETADIDRLPEDVYVRGFIRRLGDALGMDGSTLSSSLQVFESPKAVIPSWHQRSPEAPTLRPVHLYLSYAALMAGALGGLAWISYESTANEVPAQAPPTTNQQSLSQSTSAGASQTSSVAQPTGAIASPEVSPPEASQF
jgi:cytoskeleton protein RodZ